MTGCICVHFLSVFFNHEAQCIMRTTIIFNIPRVFVRAPATRTSKRVNKAVLTPFGSPTCMGLLCHCSKSTQAFASASLYSCKSFTVCRSHFERCTASELSTSIISAITDAYCCIMHWHCQCRRLVPAAWSTAFLERVSDIIRIKHHKTLQYTPVYTSVRLNGPAEAGRPSES